MSGEGEAGKIDKVSPAAIASLLSAMGGGVRVPPSLARVVVGRNGSKYSPHQGRGESARRLRQIRAGTLKGEAVTDAARFAAYGLVHPGESLK